LRFEVLTAKAIQIRAIQIGFMSSASDLLGTYASAPSEY